MSGLKTYSPLRYPGGKNILNKYVINLVKSNNLINCTYIEPYTGGGAVALKLIIDNVVGHIVINDYDRSIYAFWYSVLYHTDELCNLIEKTDITIDNWYIQKKIQKEKDTTDLLTLGFSTLFLNRTNRSGIIKAGVIGGKEQKGNYKLDCRFKKDDIIYKIRLISTYRNQITLYNLDALELINNIIPTIEGEKFIFFDPPYYKKGASLYVNYYNHEDHSELKEAISNIEDSFWIITYDNVHEISSLYYEFRQTTYNLRYTAAKKHIGQEIMIYSNNVFINEDCIKIIKKNE
ncbi:DNA adenine methylase [Metaclostridioides mangenotii]|uniref:DNA adenine methylase n=1 Tax=Metaclostridioides mangenotii TaxID=1540 RepID=UPI000B3132F9|nr:DNA adenine methylase [Clostridioides mangenotii]